MRVLHLSTADLRHGAGRAAFRLHQTLKASGVVSRMLVAEKTSEDPDVVSLMSGREAGPVRLLKDGLEVALNTWGVQNRFSFFEQQILGHPFFREADVIHCHNLHWPFRNLPLSVLKASPAKPLFWTFHDMWPFTGHCYHSFDCLRWQTGCGRCPRLLEFIPLAWDSSAFQFRFKQTLYDRSRFQVITPSTWLGNQAKESPLLSGHPVTVIPNGIDTHVFSPGDRKASRNGIGLSAGEQVVFFVAAKLDTPVKGLDILVDVLRASPFKVTLMLAGQGRPPRPGGGIGRVVWLGPSSSEQQLAQWYRAADMTVISSRAESFSNILAESMACGTPVVSFAVGAAPDFIIGPDFGWLAPAGDRAALAAGIGHFLCNPREARLSAERARERILRLCAATEVARQHMVLYDQFV